MLTSHLSSSHPDEADVDADTDVAEDDAPLKQFRRKKRRRKSGDENGVDENDICDANMMCNHNGESNKPNGDARSEKTISKKADEKSGNVVDVDVDADGCADKLEALKTDSEVKTNNELVVEAIPVSVVPSTSEQVCEPTPTPTSSEIAIAAVVPKIERSAVKSNPSTETSDSNKEDVVVEKLEGVSNLPECVHEEVIDQSIASAFIGSLELPVLSREANASQCDRDVVVVVGETSNASVTSVAAAEASDAKVETISEVVNDVGSNGAAEPESSADTVQAPAAVSSADVTDAATKADSCTEATKDKSEMPKSVRNRRSAAAAATTPTKSVVDIEPRRPERKCKTTTQALMKLTLSEDFDFADDSDESSDDDDDDTEVDADRKSVDTGSVQNEAASSASSTFDDDKAETVSIQSKPDELDSISSR